MEERPLFGDVTADVERGLAQEFVEGLALLPAHGGTFRAVQDSGWRVTDGDGAEEPDTSVGVSAMTGMIRSVLRW